MVKKRNVQNVKVKKKKWYSIIASKNFNERVLGESYVSDPAKLQHKVVTANLSTITQNMRDQNINLTFIINKVEDNKGYTELIKYKILDGFIKRFVRRDKSKIADSFITKDKNENRIRIKPLIITHNNATKAQQKLIRKQAKEFIKEMMKNNTIDSAVTSLIRKEFQRTLKKKLEKVMPIRYAEVRFLGFDNLKIKVAKKEEIITKEEADEVKEILEDKKTEENKMEDEIKQVQEEVTETKEEETTTTEAPVEETKEEETTTTEAPVEEPKKEE